MRAIAILAGLLTLAAAPVLAETKVTEAKSPMVERWEKFQGKRGLRVFNEAPCSVEDIEGFRVVFTPETGLDADQDRDCKKVYK